MKLTVNDAKLIMDAYDNINTKAVLTAAEQVMMIHYKSFDGIAKEYHVAEAVLKNQMLDTYLRILNNVLCDLRDEEDLFTINMLGINYETIEDCFRVLDVGQEN